MQIVKLADVGKNYTYHWPAGIEKYPKWASYTAIDEGGEHEATIGFGTRPVYGKDRVRVVVFIDGYPAAEFFGADDFDVSGEVLSEIKVPGDKGERMCRYPEEAIPERYVMFNSVGLPNRVDAPGIHNGWAVIANVSDHKTLIALAALRNYERYRED